MRTVFAPRDSSVFLVMMLAVDGFKGEPGTVDGKPLPLGTISFTLDLNCQSPCQLLFLSVSDMRINYLYLRNNSSISKY